MATINELKKALENNGFSAELTEVSKNGKKIHGFRIKTDSNISPVVYFNDNTDVEKYIESVRKALETPSGFGKLDFVNSWDTVKESLFVAVCNESRKDENIIYNDFISDLSEYVYIEISNDSDGVGAIRVTNQLLNQWGVSEKDLFNQAHENTSKKVFVIKTLSDTIREMLTQDGTPEEMIEMMVPPQNNDMLIVTNGERVKGACVLAVPECLSAIPDGSYYILPSSIHEILVVKEEMGNDVTFENMVREVNETQVSYDDFLSNHPLSLVIENGKVNLYSLI